MVSFLRLSAWRKLISGCYSQLDGAIRNGVKLELLTDELLSLVLETYLRI